MLGSRRGRQFVTSSLATAEWHADVCRFRHLLRALTASHGHVTSAAFKSAELTDAAAHTEPQWDLYARGVRLIALRALGNAAMADDIAQESIARAMAKAAVAPPGTIADMGAFVHGIARHLIADVHRGADRLVPLDDVEEPGVTGIDVLSALIADEERARVREAIAQLSEGDRDILRWSFFDGLQPDEIARRIRQSAVSVRKRKSRALDRLRRAFFGLVESR